MKPLLFSFILLFSSQSFAFFADVGPLLQLVAGQIQEIERLSETVGLAREQREYLIALNQGIQRTVSQIEALQHIVQKSKNLDPRSIRSVTELNDYLNRAKDAKSKVEEILKLKLLAADTAVSAASEQSQFAYTMGQEMIRVGASLAEESRSASPGRAAQISAASLSAQMVSQGTLLQSLSQISQLQALILDLEKSKIQQSMMERELENDAVIKAMKKRIKPKKEVIP